MLAIQIIFTVVFLWLLWTAVKSWRREQQKYLHSSWKREKEGEEKDIERK